MKKRENGAVENGFYEKKKDENNINKDEKKNSEAYIFKSNDEMKAFISLTEPEGGRNLTEKEIMSLLSKEGIVNGIKNDIVKALVKRPEYKKEYCIAEGTEPIDGKDGRIKFLFDRNKKYKPKILKNGSVDFRQLDIIENVKKDDVLCKIYPPEEGMPGKCVTGNEIPAKEGKPVKIPKGKNVETDGDRLIASIDGQVTYENGKVSVTATYEVDSNVNNSTGNIEFIGNVVIKGNVLSDFRVEADGFVEVWGVVEGAAIKAGTDIILRRGMHGQGKGILKSGNDIIASYIEYSKMDAKNDIKAEAIMHSEVKCGNRLELSGRKGLLVGGAAKVGREVIAKVIGSHMATVTKIEVGVDPGIKEGFKKAKTELKQNKKEMEKTGKVITLFQKLQKAGALPEEKKELLQKSIRTRIFLSKKLNELKQETTEIENKMKEDASGTVTASNCIYPGTSVAIGNYMMYVKDIQKNCTLYRDGADVRVGPLK